MQSAFSVLFFRSLSFALYLSLSAGQTIEIDSFTLQLSVAAAARIVGPGMARQQTMSARERTREKALTTIENQNNNKHTQWAI